MHLALTFATMREAYKMNVPRSWLGALSFRGTPTTPTQLKFLDSYHAFSINCKFTSHVLFLAESSLKQQHRWSTWEWITGTVKTNLRRLRVLLSPTNKSIFIGLSVAGEAVDLWVGSKRALVVNVAAANSPDTPCVHWLTAVLYLGHGSKKANWLASIANVSELVDSSKSNLLFCICCRLKLHRRHDFSTRVELSNYCSLCRNYLTLRFNCEATLKSLCMSWLG